MNKTLQEADAKYFFVFHGHVPGILMARVAYRRAGRQELSVLNARKIINCPFCGKPLTDVDRDTKVELYHNPARKQVRCQAYPICNHCGNEVGIIIV